ncbi:MAG: hypothetical protein R3E48_13470 [Burkholderiaceae bacterium]
MASARRTSACSRSRSARGPTGSSSSGLAAGLLVQTPDIHRLDAGGLRVVTERELTQDQLEDLSCSLAGCPVR